MEITNAKYMRSTLSNEITGISATIDGIDSVVPICEGNRHYDFIIENNIIIEEE